MKVITLSAVALMLLGTLTLGMADEVSVDEQITAIQEAPAQERVQLMNQFKERLATMNADEREAAITQLRTQTQTQTRTQDGTAEGEQIQTRTMTKERSRVNEMQQTQQQQMQQQQMQQQQRMQQQMQQQLESVGTSVPTPVAGH